MISQVEGIIIKETPYSDSSKIIQVLTKDRGIIGIMAKGAKSMKSKLRAVTLKYTYGIFHLYYKENKLSTLVDVDVIDHLTNIKNDITLISYLTYLTELTTQVIKQNSITNIYEDYINSIFKINEGLDPLIITNILEIKALPDLGVGLNLDSCVKCGNNKNIITIDGDAGGYICCDCHTNELVVSPKTIKMLRMYYYVDIKSITNLNISKKVKEEINYFLDKYYERYTGLYLNSKDFLKTIASI